MTPTKDLTANYNHGEALRTLLYSIRHLMRSLGAKDISDADLIDGTAQLEHLLRHLRTLSENAEVAVKVGGHMTGSNVGNGLMLTEGDIIGGDKIEFHIAMHPALPSVVEPVNDDLSELEQLYYSRVVATTNPVPLGGGRLFGGSIEAGMPRLEKVYAPLMTDRRGGNGSPVPAMAAVIRIKKLVVLGEPGAGKTSLLQRVAFCLASASLFDQDSYLDVLAVAGEDDRRSVSWTHGRLMPVLLKLDEIEVQGNQPGDARMIANAIHRMLERQDLSDCWPIIRRAMVQGRVLFLFDGLDEAVNARQRQRLREAIEDFANTYGNNRFIVTCRQLSYGKPFRLAGFPIVNLAPLTLDGVREFIAGWYAEILRREFMPAHRAVLASAHLQRIAEEVPDIASNPLLLTVMTATHMEYGQLPRHKVHLLGLCVRLMLWEWQVMKGRRIGALRDERLIIALADIAFRMQSQNLNGEEFGLPHATVIETLRAVMGLTIGQAEQVCTYLELGACMLHNRGYEDERAVYGFAHRSLREYLAGLHIAHQHGFSRRVRDLIVRTPAWREVVVLAAGHLALNEDKAYVVLDAADLLVRSENVSREIRWGAVWAAAEMLALLGTEAVRADEWIGHKLLARLTSELAVLVQSRALPLVERVHAARILGALGDPRPGVASLPPDFVSVDRPRGSLYVSRYPVTWGMYQAFIDAGGYEEKAHWGQAGWEWVQQSRQGNPPERGTLVDNMPVVGVSWYEAQAFIRWLSARSQQTYALLTEAEWEWVACGETLTKYPFGAQATDQAVNVRDSGVGRVVSVGVFVHDVTRDGVCEMSGNIMEWCADDIDGKRVLKGAAYNTPKRDVAVSARELVEAGTTLPTVGFRLRLVEPLL